MLEDIKAITELEPSGIIHIAVLFSGHKLDKSYLFGGVLLLGRQPLVQNAYFQANFNINTNSFSDKFKIIFPLSVLFCKERPMFIFDICI